MPAPGNTPATSKRSAVNDPQGGRGFNVSDFKAHRNKIGILRTHDFHIEIPWPEGLSRDASLTDIARNLELTCDTVNFPGTALQTHTMQRYSYGAFETRPTAPAFNELACTFMCDQYANLWRFFHRWMQVAVNYDFDLNPTATGTMAVYEISYRHEYAVDMFLYIYNPLGTLVRKVGFRSAYPIAVPDVQMNWAARDQMIKIPVTFSFIDWSEFSVTGGQAAPLPTTPGSGSGIGGVGPGLG